MYLHANRRLPAGISVREALVRIKVGGSVAGEEVVGRKQGFHGEVSRNLTKNGKHDLDGV